jgi:hypothetical protein
MSDKQMIEQLEAEQSMFVQTAQASPVTARPLH